MIKGQGPALKITKRNEAELRILNVAKANELRPLKSAIGRTGGHHSKCLVGLSGWSFLQTMLGRPETKNLHGKMVISPDVDKTY